MRNINSEEEINTLIQNSKMGVIYFSGTSCGACEIIKDKVTNILTKYPRIESAIINGEAHIELSAKFNVFSLPILLLYVEGKETIRVGRNVNLLELEGCFERYYGMIFS